MNLAQIPEHTLLEAGDLPFGDLVRFALREGRRPRPIYQIHKWFARRLGCSFRALLVGAVQDTTADFWKAYYETADLSGLTMLDPFVGGGTSVVEAARLGATAIGVDIDPIACVVTAAELTAADFDDLAPAMQALKEKVGKRLAPLYSTRGVDGTRLMVLHNFWVQVVECPSCGQAGEAHPNFVLAEEETAGRWAFCRHCHEVHKLRARQARFTCRNCSKETDVNDAPVLTGAYTCSRCSHREPLIEFGRAARTPPSWRLFAIEATPRTSGRAVPVRERLFFRASAADSRAFTRARKMLAQELRADRDFLPAHAICQMQRSDSRITDYGYRRWTQLFNERQLLHLGLLAQEIKRLPERLLGPIGLAFSNHLATNCMLTSYAAGWRRLTPLFSIRAFRHVPRPVEVNPWSEGTGRGTFPNAVRQVLRASAFARAPKEPGRRGGFRAVSPVAPVEQPKVVSGNARELAFVESASVDLVLTDPPYYDNVAYSELSEFFQPWLEHLNLVPKAAERRQLIEGALRAQRRNEASLEEFAKRLGEAFGEMYRVLKPRGLLAFTFRHSTTDAWFAMAKALARSRLRPVQVLLMPGEAGTGLHTHDGTSLWDAVLVFRKLPASVPATSLSMVQVEAARANAHAWRERFRRQDRLPFNDADYVNLLRASLVAASLGLYGRQSRQLVELRSALEDADPR